MKPSPDTGPGANAPLQWRLHTVMSERGIRTTTELHRRLESSGLDITPQQLSRIVARLPRLLNTTVLAALMTSLECTASDLLRPSARAGAARRRTVDAAPSAADRPTSPVVAPVKPPESLSTPSDASPQQPARPRKVWDVCGPHVDSLAGGHKPKPSK